MLKFIRRNAGGVWVKAIFAAIVIVFVFWGVGGGIDGSVKEDWVAKVNEDTIETLEFRRTHDNLYRLYENVYKDNFKPELAKMLDLKNKAIDQLVRVSLMRQEAERLGLHASDSEVRKAIAEIKAFQNENGSFDKAHYLNVLRANRLTAGDFEATQREELLVNKLQDVIAAGALVSEAEALERYHFENDKVTLKFVKFEPSAFAAEVQLADGEAQKYYDANQEQFREQDKVRIDYVHYAPEKFTAKVLLNDSDLQAYYDAHQSEYERPEQVSARHILLKLEEEATPEQQAEARKKAEELLAKAKGGEDFAALATANSQDEGSAKKGGDLGAFARGAMVKPFEDAAFALNPGDISEIVESPFGLHIIKVEGKTPAHTQTLDEVRAAITEKVKSEKAHELAREQATADQAKVEGGESLAAVAAAADLTVESPEPFAISAPPAGVGRGPLPNAAFTAEPGKVAPVVEAPNGYYVFVLKEKIASHIPALAEIRERVDKAVRDKKAEELAKSKAEAALAELQKSGDIDAIAQANNLTADESGEFARQGGYISKIGTSADLKKAAFALTPQQRVAPAVYNVSGASIIATLKDVSIADEEKFKTDKDNLMRQAEERRKGQVLEEFVNYLKARAKVEVNQEFLASIPDSGRMLGGRQ